MLKFLQKNSSQNVQTKGGGVKGFLNNVKKKLHFSCMKASLSIILVEKSAFKFKFHIFTALCRFWSFVHELLTMIFFFANYLFHPGWQYSYELKNPLFNLPMLNFVSILETPHSSFHAHPSRESDRKLLLPWLGSQRLATGCLLSTEIINVLQI